MGSVFDLALGGLGRRRKPGAAERLYGEGDTEVTRGAGYDQAMSASRARFSDFLGGGESELNRYIQGAVSAGMPEFNRNLQGVRENAIARGIGGGGLGTSYEGDLASAFHRNISNSAAGQAMNLYNTRAGGYQDLYGTDVELAEGSRNRYLDILGGQADRDQAAQNAKRKKILGIFGFLLALLPLTHMVAGVA